MAPSVGDAFCFLILALPDDVHEITTSQVLARSVVWPRYPREDAPDAIPEETAASEHSLMFYKNDETTVLDDPPALDTEDEAVDDSSDVPTSPEELWGRRYHLMIRPIGNLSNKKSGFNNQIKTTIWIRILF